MLIYLLTYCRVFRKLQIKIRFIFFQNLIYYRPTTKLPEGNVLSRVLPVCQSAGGRGGGRFNNFLIFKANDLLTNTVYIFLMCVLKSHLQEMCTVPILRSLFSSKFASVAIAIANWSYIKRTRGFLRHFTREHK